MPIRLMIMSVNRSSELTEGVARTVAPARVVLEESKRIARGNFVAARADVQSYDGGYRRAD